MPYDRFWSSFKSSHYDLDKTHIYIYIYKQINNSIQLRFICKLTKDQKVSIEAKLKERKEIPRLLNFNKLKRPTTDVKHIKIGQIFVR
jgi:hypothetical protein